MPLFGCNDTRIIDGVFNRLAALINQWGNSLLQGIVDVQVGVDRARHDIRNSHQVLTGLSFQSNQRFNQLEARMTADFTAVNEALANLTREVSETADVLHAQSAKIEELKSQINDPTVQAQLDNIAAAINEKASQLDALQPKSEPPTDEDEEPGDTDPTT